MANSPLSILVVDDAKFSCVMIGRTLTQAGYDDIRVADTAAQAILNLKERPANVLLADWQMPEMDGLELASHVRRLDQEAGHYTYIILLTGREGEKVLSEAFKQGIDDFISKTVMNEQLLPRMYAAERLCSTLQRLQQEKNLLLNNVARLEEHNLIDPITGLGNLRYLRQYLTNCLRQVESRGGALCYLLIGLDDVDTWLSRYGLPFHNALLQAVAQRLQQLVRPLDLLVCLDDRHFALVALLSELHACSSHSFRHVHDGINLKAFKTTEGFINLKASFALVGLDHQALPTQPEEILALSTQLLEQARHTGRITEQRLSAP
jgi:diguanylate cyclase (GGDEF)-like protein